MLAITITIIMIMFWNGRTETCSLKSLISHFLSESKLAHHNLEQLDVKRHSVLEDLKLDSLDSKGGSKEEINNFCRKNSSIFS